jgi:hypothetical protein
MPMLNPDYSDMLSALSVEGAEFLIVGAFALAALGLPRATGDIDIWIGRSPENAERIMRALLQFGAPVHGLNVADLESPDVVFQIGVAPRRIDILTSIDGVAFEDAWASRMMVTFEGLTVPVISRAHLIQNKRASGRPKDLADLAWLDLGPP